jgi:NSS family neurotransmitter:Na+ symporter
MTERPALSPAAAPAPRESFASRFGLRMTMIGVAVGLGNVWRFPYMAGKFGGAAFVAFYLLAVLLIGLPALMAEWALGRHTRRGPVGAYAAAGLPLGRAAGWFFFAVVAAATAYYTNVIGWVLAFALGELARGLGWEASAAAVLPPESGVDGRSLLLQVACTAAILLACAGVLLAGLRRGIEVASKVLMPALYAILLLLIVRALTLPGAFAGLDWYILKFDPAAVTPRVMVAALGQAVFSLSLGGTFMVVYGSYLAPGERLGGNAAWTAAGDTLAGLLAGLAIFPAVFALGLAPGSGPGLLFDTLPRVFAALPAGWLFGLLFFLGLGGAAYLSDVAALEVLVAGLTDNTRLGRTAAVWTAAALVFILALVPMTNLRVFTTWDLTFGSGMQTLGALLAALTVGWCLPRLVARQAMAAAAEPAAPAWLHAWIRWCIPAAILTVGLWWLLSEALGWVRGV